MSQLLPCPFCGTVPNFPDGRGTQYEIECNVCWQASAFVQIVDLMEDSERTKDAWIFKSDSYKPEFVERAKIHTTVLWNTRAHTKNWRNKCASD